MIQSAGPPPVRLPTVVGKPCPAAVAALTHLGFTASCSGVPPAYSTTVAGRPRDGRLRRQLAEPVDGRVRLGALGPAVQGPPARARCRTSSGCRRLQALSALQQSGFVPVARPRVLAHGAPWRRHHDDAAPRHVAPAGQGESGSSCRAGAPTTVPSLGGADLATAETILVDHGLTVIAAHGAVSSHSWISTPPAGTVVPKGTGVTLYGH